MGLGTGDWGLGKRYFHSFIVLAWRVLCAHSVHGISCINIFFRVNEEREKNDFCKKSHCFSTDCDRDGVSLIDNSQLAWITVADLLVKILHFH
jgi:Tat protein secretion system quality control protein TatD with DNase activity